MASTYSNLKIQLMATGENTTTWGDVTNINLGTALEEAIVGSADVTFASANVTLSLTNTNASQAARNMRLRCTGTTGGSTRNLVVPSIEKPYLVKNDCADSILVKTAAGTGITVPAGKTMWVYNDGTNVVDATTYLTALALGTALSVSSGGTGANTLTSGYLVKGNGTSAVSASVVYDAGTNVGIGTSAPWELLSIPFNNGIALGSSTYSFKIQRSSSGELVTTFSDTYDASTARIDFTMRSGAAAQNTPLSILGSGNVGIGTTSPNHALHVYGGASTQITVQSSTNYGGNFRAINTVRDYTFGLTGATTGDFLIYDNTNSQLAYNYLSATGHIWSTAGIERLRIGTSGQIGLSGANYGTSGQVLTSQGASSAPVWATVASGTVTSVAGTGTVNGLTLTGTVTTSGSLTLGGTLSGVSLTSAVTGTLPIANGGTGATTAANALTALGAYAASNPAGYTTNTGTVTSVSGTGSANGLSLSGTVTTSGSITLSGSVTSVATGATIDGVTIGYRNIPRSTTSGTATTSDVGKVIAVSAGITIPNATFAAGDAVSIYNDSASSITITQGTSLTLRQAGTANTGNRTLAARGMATIWFNSSSEAIISGAGVS